MPAAANEMKAILLEILEQAFQPADVTATQQMGVQMSNAVKREGVVIIQNQNVEVYARIMPSMVRALRLCDSFEPVVEITHEPLQLPEARDYETILDRACEWLFVNGYKWEKAQEIFKENYLSYVVGQFKTKREAAEFLGVGATYLSKMTVGKEEAE
jgi:hypothetical protein